MSGVILYDHRLVSAADMIAASFSRLAVASRVQKRIVTLGPNQSPAASNAHIQVTGYSTEQVHAPERLAADATFIYALGVNTLMRFTNANTPIIQITMPIVCDRPTWLIRHDGFILAPYTGGGIQVFDTSCSFLGLFYDGLIRASLAVFDGTEYLYVIDDTNGKGHVLQLTSIGTLKWISKFGASNCRGVRGGFVDGDKLTIATQHQVIVFDLADPEIPVFDDSTRVPDADITGIVSLGGGDYWLTTRSYYKPQAARFAIGSTMGVNVPNLGLFVLHADVGAVSGQALEDGPSVYAGIDQSVPFDTFTLTGSKVGPGSGSLAILWTLDSGPGTATFVDDTALITDVDVSVAGIYVFKLTGTDGPFETSDTITVTVQQTRDIVRAMPASPHYPTLNYPIGVTLVLAPSLGNTHTVTFTSGSSGLTVVSGTPLTFNSTNWNVAQYLTVKSSGTGTKTINYTVTPVVGTPIVSSFTMDFDQIVGSPAPDITYIDEVFDLVTTSPTSINYVDEIFVTAITEVVEIDAL